MKNDQKPNWALRRLGFRCQCEKCMATVGEINRRANPAGGGRGKMWQARYGESATDFKKRFEEFHKS